MQALILALYPEYSKRVYTRNIISVHYIMIRDKNKKEKYTPQDPFISYFKGIGNNLCI